MLNKEVTITKHHKTDRDSECHFNIHVFINTSTISYLLLLLLKSTEQANSSTFQGGTTDHLFQPSTQYIQAGIVLSDPRI